MMAWKAVVTDSDIDFLTVGYYDDTDPANNSDPTKFLFSRAFSNMGGIPRDDLRSQIIAFGNDKRTALRQVQQLVNDGPLDIP
jgi:hypothetical protein